MTVVMKWKLKETPFSDEHGGDAQICWHDIRPNVIRSSVLNFFWSRINFTHRLSVNICNSLIFDKAGADVDAKESFLIWSKTYPMRARSFPLVKRQPE